MIQASTSPLIVLAAGGTGGHVFPAEALASALLARGYRLALVTDRRGQTYGGALGQLETHRISAGGVAGRGMMGRLKGALDLGLGTLQARSLLRRLAPSAVIGFGGYAALPTVVAAISSGLPTAIHEQNAVLGRANRLLAGRVRRIATSFAEVKYATEAGTEKIVYTGMPVRAMIAAQRDVPYPDPSASGPINLVVLGGSQGARIFSEVVPAALKQLPDALRTRIHLSQQCRPEDIEQVRLAYEGTGIAADLQSFFADVPRLLAGAHLVIARSGASTMAELTTLGRPAILVPYPHAIDDHQTANAHALDEAGGGWLIPQANFTASGLAARIESLLSLPGSLSKAASCARAAGRPDAAERLADMVASLLTAKSQENHQ